MIDPMRHDTVLHVADVDLALTRAGSGDPLLLLTGLGGAGRGWGELVDRFAATFTVLVPDHPGTGGSSRPPEHTLGHHALAMAEAIRTLDVGACHVVGSSTGGAIGQLMALDHPDTVRSLSLVSSWGRADDFFRHQFAVRRDVLVRLGSAAYAETSALFLFSPGYFRDHYQGVRAWAAAAGGGDPEVMTARIDMILAHDVLDRLGEIRVPTLVLVGDDDACTPVHLSRELAEAIPGAHLEILPGGHLIYQEAPAEFLARIVEFVGSR